MNNLEELLKVAKERGYHENMRNSNNTWFGLHHDRYKIHLDLYPESEEFSLSTMKGIIKITTDKCGSFSNDIHFLGLQRQIIEIIDKLS